MTGFTSIVDSRNWSKYARSTLKYKVPEHAQATEVPRTYGLQLLHRLLRISRSSTCTRYLYDYARGYVKKFRDFVYIEGHPHIRQPRRTTIRFEETDHSPTRLQRCFLILLTRSSSVSNTLSSCYPVYRLAWLRSPFLVFQRLALRRRRALLVPPIEVPVCISVAVGGLFRLVRMSVSC